MDRRLHPRRPLSQIVLAGSRGTVHGMMRWAIAGLAALAAVLVVTEEHRVCNAWGACDASDWGPSHTLVADAGGMPLLLLALVGALQLFGKDSKFLPRLLTAIGSTIVGLFLLVEISFAHLLSYVEGGDGAAFLAFVVMATAFVQIIVEPVLTVRQRRELEATEPVFPRAAIVTR